AVKALHLFYTVKRYQLMSHLTFLSAHRHQLHVIANELYGLSMYDPDVNFTSILSLPHPDPERVHFLWGFSKDFGLSGIRVSTMYTRHPGLIEYFQQTGIYIRPTEMAQNRLQHLIDDRDYMDKQALPEIKRRMWTRHQSIKAQIEGCGGRVHPSPATVFRWLDLSSFLTSPDPQGEQELFDRLYAAGVHLMTGDSLGHPVSGWFRMVAGLEDDVHSEGMNRLVNELNAIRREQQQQQQQ
ncbi:1-aminocyclopropane-1-carboxylate synthase-like protein 1, partial [Elysia marginata]